MLKRGGQERREKRDGGVKGRDVKQCVRVRRGGREEALHLIFLSRAISLVGKVSLSLGPCLLQVL